MSKRPFQISFEVIPQPEPVEKQPRQVVAVEAGIRPLWFCCRWEQVPFFVPDCTPEIIEQLYEEWPKNIDGEPLNFAQFF